MAEKRTRVRKGTHQPDEKCAEPGDRSADEELYTRNVLIRGEAAKRDVDGELPPDATHEVLEDAAEEGELPKIRRRRFSAF